MNPIDDKEIANFLETEPLYKWIEFKRPVQGRSDFWVREINTYCEQCGRIRPFHPSKPGNSTYNTGTSYLYFICVTCKEKREFLVEHIFNEETIKIQKYGELPRKSIERDKILQKFFSEDSEYYEKAVVCLSNGYGIAAFAYFRRIIENNVNKLLNLINDEVEYSANYEEIKTALEELKNESPMSDKIKVANKVLPEYLKPSGLNPLGRLYQVLSEGVHKLNDHQCLQKTKEVQECIKYLISELSDRKKNRDRFKSVVGVLK